MERGQTRSLLSTAVACACWLVGTKLYKGQCDGGGAAVEGPCWCAYVKSFHEFRATKFVEQQGMEGLAVVVVVEVEVEVAHLLTSLLCFAHEGGRCFWSRFRDNERQDELGVTPYTPEICFTENTVAEDLQTTPYSTKSDKELCFRRLSLNHPMFPMAFFTHAIFTGCVG